MALTGAEVTAMKTYINGLYSEKQLIKWTNPDTNPTPSSIDDDVYTNMINSAYEMYLSFYSPTFSTSLPSAVDKLAHGVILTMVNWRNENKFDIISTWYTSLKKGIIRQQMIKPMEIESTSVRASDKRDPDSPYVTYLGTDYGTDNDSNTLNSEDD